MNNLAVDNMHMIKPKKTDVKFLSLVWLLLFTCGNPFTDFYLGRFMYIVLAMVVFIAYRPRFSGEDKQTLLRWISLLVVIFVGQLAVLKHISYLACGNYIAKLLVAFSIAIYLGESFKKAYLSVMTTICVISLICYSLEFIGISLPSLLPSGQAGSIGFYTFQPISEYSNRLRNCGMFWEPGAFAGYINIAFLLYVNSIKELLNNKWKLVFLLGALITTFSTTGYICFAIIFLFFIWGSHINKTFKIIFLAIILLASAYAFVSFDFLGEKINEQFLAASELSFDANEHSRFGSILIDWYYIRLHPLFGNGFALSTRYAYHLQFYDEGTLMGFGNGFTGIIGTLGIPFILFYLYFFFKNKTLSSRLFVAFFVVLLLQGEQYLNYPLFLMLPFVKYGTKKS